MSSDQEVPATRSGDIHTLNDAGAVLSDTSRKGRPARLLPPLSTLPNERAAMGWMLPGATRGMLDMDEEAAQEHLQKLAAQWRKKGISVTNEEINHVS